MKKVLVAILLTIVGFAAKAQLSAPIYITFTSDPSSWVTPPGGGGPCSSTVTVVYTSMSGSYPVSIMLNHTFALGDTYTFVLNNPAPTPMVEFSFSVPCRMLSYGSYTQTSVDAAGSLFTSGPVGGGSTHLFIHNLGGGNYSYNFENPDGVYP